MTRPYCQITGDPSEYGVIPHEIAELDDPALFVEPHRCSRMATLSSGVSQIDGFPGFVFQGLAIRLVAQHPVAIAASPIVVAPVLIRGSWESNW
jgi:hypothetical protein